MPRTPVAILNDFCFDVRDTHLLEVDHVLVLMGGSRWTHRLLMRILGVAVQDIAAVCCGMVGAFDYDIENAKQLPTIARQRLLPRLSKANAKTQILSNRFSCRHQFADLSGCKSQHVAKLLRGLCEAA